MGRFSEWPDHLPNPDGLRSSLSPEDAWSGGRLGMSLHDTAGASALAGGGSPFSAIPVSAESGEWGEAIAIFNDDQDNLMDNYGHDQTAGEHWYNEGGDQDYGYTYQNLAENAVSPSNPGTAPAAITYMPTSSTNPERPRTVAAGWDRQRHVITTVFRDGTFYNYYDCNAAIWNNFKAAYSKGHFILAHLDSHARGVSDIGAIPNAMRESLYRLARTGQVMRDGLTGKQSNAGRDRYVKKVDKARAATGSASVYRPGNLGGTGRKRAKGK